MKFKNGIETLQKCASSCTSINGNVKGTEECPFQRAKFKDAELLTFQVGASKLEKYPKGQECHLYGRATMYY